MANAATTITGASPTLSPFGTVLKTGTGSGGSSSTATTSGSSATSTTADKSALAKTSLNQNFDQFLTMLTTQMKNQDPLNPMDSNQMTQQLVQFSMAEQAINTNQKLEQLVKLQQSNTMINNMSYIGRVVQYKGSDFQYVTGMQSADLAYKLDSNAKSVSIQINDANGNTVRTLKGDTGGGSKHDVPWDFKDEQGNTVPQGKYTIKVVPQGNSKDDYIGYTPYTFAVVTGVDFDANNNPILRSGDSTTVPIDQIVGVY